MKDFFFDWKIDQNSISEGWVVANFLEHWCRWILPRMQCRGWSWSRPVELCSETRLLTIKRASLYFDSFCSFLISRGVFWRNYLRLWRSVTSVVYTRYVAESYKKNKRWQFVENFDWVIFLIERYGILTLMDWVLRIAFFVPEKIKIKFCQFISVFRLQELAQFWWRNPWIGAGTYRHQHQAEVKLELGSIMYSTILVDRWKTNGLLIFFVMVVSPPERLLISILVAPAALTPDLLTRKSAAWST